MIDLLFYILVSTIAKVIGFVRLVVIIQFLMGLALAFNLISTRNTIVRTIWDALNALLAPLLDPIRRVLPNTGGIDFSPMVLIMIMSLIGELIGSIAMLGF